MYIIPSVYIRNNKTVALDRGGSIFNENPVEMSKQLESVGAELLYVVDLDTPPAGVSPNLSTIEKICKETTLKLQITGNIRSNDVVERYIHAGVQRAILGTLAYQKPDFLKGVCEKFPGKIGVHIDVRAGKVVIKGWTVATRKTALNYAEQFSDAGVNIIIYSDLQEEGKITPADIQRILEFSRHSPMQVIHGSDINSATELELVLGLHSNKLIGTIIGKSMYSGLIDISSTITHVKEESPAETDEPTLIP